MLPYPWGEAEAAAYAAAHGAVLARGRRQALTEGGGPSLSPASLVATEAGARLVLPSPNGSMIAHALAAGGATVVAASLRNAPAVAGWLAARAEDGPVAVLAAGERWPDGSLRPAVEDLWGAGAVVDALADSGVTGLSPEAAQAAAAFAAVRDRVADELARCASGRELVAAGFADDVRLAGEHAVARVVPVLGNGAFRG
ncbi:MAG: 2-phosphosulfolactate phosphatase [Nocardioides sp.]